MKNSHFPVGVRIEICAPTAAQCEWLGTAEGSWGPPVPACQSSRMLGYPGNGDDIAGDAGKLCPRCAGCHRRCQGNSRRHPAGELGAGVGAEQPSFTCSPAGLGGLWDMPWGLALSLPSPWGTGEEMRRRFPSWGYCHPHLGLVEQGQRGHCSLPHHCWISTKQHPGTHSPACLMEPTPWRKTFTPPCHLQLNPSLCFPLLKGSETPQTPQDFFPSVPNPTTITPGRVSPHL